MKKEGMCKLSGIVLSLTVISLFGVYSLAYAVDKEEFTSEFTEAYQELLKTDPEVAAAFKAETTEALRRGDLELTSAGGETAETATKDVLKEIKDTVSKGDYAKAEAKQAEALEALTVEKDKLLKAGLTEADVKSLESAMKEGNWQEADKLFEKVSGDWFEGKGEFGPGDYGRSEYGKGEFAAVGLEAREHAYTPEEALKEFYKEMDSGRMDHFSKDDLGRMEEAMQRGDFEAAGRIGQEAGARMGQEGGETHYREVSIEQMREGYEKATGEKFTEAMEKDAREMMQGREIEQTHEVEQVREVEQMREMPEQERENLQDRMGGDYRMTEPMPQP